MKQPDIQNEIVRRLYDKYFCGDGILSLREICDAQGWEENAFQQVVRNLSEQYLIKQVTLDMGYLISGDGVIHFEELGLVPDELLKQNEQARTIALDELARTYLESTNFHATTYLSSLSESTGLEVQVLVCNLGVLEDLGYVDMSDPGSYKITSVGLAVVEDWKRRFGMADKFERLKEMAPHPRGMAFQKFLAEVIEGQGWNQEEGVKTSNEEMDVIASRGREYYLVECKWEKDPIKSAIVRELYGKISNRSGVQGIIVSMSSFTSGAIGQVKEFANNKVILLFGPEDVRSLVYERDSFENLVNLKYHKLAIKKEVMVN